MFTNTNAIRTAKPALVRRHIGQGPVAPVPTAVILDFARARSVESTAQIRAAASNERPNRLALGDLAVITGLFLVATAYYPVLTWLLLLTGD